MNLYNHTFYSSFSAEKTDISSQLDNTHKMIKDFNTLKKKVKLYQTKQKGIKIEKFHKNSIRSLVYRNFKKKILLNKEEKSEEKTNFFLPECPKSKKTNLEKKIFNTTFNIPYFRRTIENNSNKISKTRKRIDSNSFIIVKKSRNKPKLFKNFNLTMTNSYILSYRNETLSEFNNKSKEMVLSNYIKNLQEHEIKKFNEGIQIKLDLYDIEIHRLEEMIFLIKTFIKDDEKYLEHLKKTLKIERELNEMLIEKKEQCFIESFLLNRRLVKIGRKYSQNINNKFFLICVKNGTNQIEKFTEEDKKDYDLDKETMEYLSNFTLFETMLNKLSKEEYDNLSINEIENVIFGRKLIRPPKIIFNSPDIFKKKLNEIENNIQNSLIIFNKSQKELQLIRDEFNSKMNLIEGEKNVHLNFQNEFENYMEKYNEVKHRNDYLKIYIKQIKLQSKKSIKLNIVEDKIFEIYIEINKIFPLFKKRKFNEKNNTILYLQDLEITINNLIKYENQQKLINNQELINFKKSLMKKHKIQKIEELKKKAKMEIEEKIQRILIKNNQFIFKQNRKIDMKMKKKKEKKIIQNDKEENYYFEI